MDTSMDNIPVNRNNNIGGTVETGMPCLYINNKINKMTDCDPVTGGFKTRARIPFLRLSVDINRLFPEKSIHWVWNLNGRTDSGIIL